MAIKVAVVDDDLDIREALLESLAEAGYQVSAFSDGLQLLAWLETELPEVILLDVSMSWIDGLALCQALKRNRAYSRIPVLFISARTTPDDVRRGLEAGADGYFTKPFDLELLLRRLELMTAPPRSPSA